IAILNEYGEPVHLMLPQSRLLVRITLRAEQSLATPVVGFVLRNHLGIDFAETTTALPALRNGDLRTVDFLIDLPEFYPGAFSFSPYLKDTEVCDWIDNAVTVQMGKGEGPV